MTNDLTQQPTLLFGIPEGMEDAAAKMVGWYGWIRDGFYLRRKPLEVDRSLFSEVSIGDS